MNPPDQTDSRWMSPDPMGGDVTDPQSLNRYAYGLNNPATLNDPSGLQPDGGYCDPFDPEGCPPPSCGGDLDLTPCPPVYCGPLNPEACSPLCYYLGNCWGYGNGYGAGGAEDTSIPPPTASPAGQPPLGGGTGVFCGPFGCVSPPFQNFYQGVTGPTIWELISAFCERDPFFCGDIARDTLDLAKHYLPRVEQGAKAWGMAQQCKYAPVLCSEAPGQQNSRP